MESDKKVQLPVLKRTGFDSNGTIYINDHQVEVNVVNGNRTEAMTIAKGIEALPDLLEALEAFVQDVKGHPSCAAREHYKPLVEKAVSAIKKARGI